MVCVQNLPLSCPKMCKILTNGESKKLFSHKIALEINALGGCEALAIDVRADYSDRWITGGCKELV